VDPLESLIEEIIQSRCKEQRNACGSPYSEKQKAQLKKFLKTKAKGRDRDYLSISLGGPKSFVASFEKTIDTGYRVVVISPFYFSKGAKTSQIVGELRQVRKVHAQSKLPICVSIPASDQKLFRTIKRLKGWHFSSIGYFGNVKDSLSRLKGAKNLDSALQLRPMRLKADAESVHCLELRAFTKEKRSVLYRFGIPTKKLWIKEYAKRNPAFVAVLNEKIVGYIGFEKDRGAPATYFLASIAVLPSYQGRGIAKLLYKAGLESLNAKDARHYTGFSSTPKVMKMARFLKRKKSSIGFYLPGKKIKAKA